MTKPSKINTPSTALENKQDGYVPTPVADDEKLWIAFKNGSESAFVAIYNKYFQILYNYGRQFSGNRPLIKDCIQNTFITLRNIRHKLPTVASVQAYLFKSYRNNLLKELKKENKVSSTDGKPLDFELVHSAEHVMIEKQFREGQVRKITKAIQYLSMRQKEAIYYYFYNDLSYQEIKEIMGFSSIEATRNLLYRAITTLRKHF